MPFTPSPKPIPLDILISLLHNLHVFVFSEEQSCRKISFPTHFVQMKRFMQGLRQQLQEIHINVLGESRNSSLRTQNMSKNVRRNSWQRKEKWTWMGLIEGWGACTACTKHWHKQSSSHAKQSHMHTAKHQAQNKGSQIHLYKVHLDPIHLCTSPQESDGGQHAWAETSISMGLGRACRGKQEDKRGHKEAALQV